MNCDPRINNLIVGNVNSVIQSNFTLVDLNVSFQFFSSAIINLKYETST